MILSIDAGTTGVTVIAVNLEGKITARGYQEFPQHYPQPGWVEHDLEEIWQATLSAARKVIAQVGNTFSAIGITNQRETVGLWNRKTLVSPCKAIVWQDRRTTEVLEELKSNPAINSVQQKTGLPLDPYFSASKLRWLAKNHPSIWEEVTKNDTIVGTIDTYLISRLTDGEAHITDASNASRTQLYNIHTGAWDQELLELFDIPEQALPTIVDSSGHLAISNPAAFLGIEVTITGIAGDQQAALFGQTQFDVGGAKCTYGTGAFILQNTGDKAILQDNGLITTVAWQLNGVRTFANEGSVFVAGAAVQWLRDELKIINSAEEIEALAKTVTDNGGIVFVPALTGLGAPYWIPDARGSVFGLTRGTQRGNLARATLEALAFQVKDVFDAMATTGVKLNSLRVDGGASANDLLIQIQADQLQVPIERPSNLDSTALGAAYLAGLGIGYWKDLQTLRGLNPVETSFTPENTSPEPYKRWKQAVQATIAFAEN
jgi:glycerol kinase